MWHMNLWMQVTKTMCKKGKHFHKGNTLLVALFWLSACIHLLTFSNTTKYYFS